MTHTSLRQLTLITNITIISCRLRPNIHLQTLPPSISPNKIQWMISVSIFYPTPPTNHHLTNDPISMSEISGSKHILLLKAMRVCIMAELCMWHQSIYIYMSGRMHHTICGSFWRTIITKGLKNLHPDCWCIGYMWRKPQLKENYTRCRIESRLRGRCFLVQTIDCESFVQLLEQDK